MAEKPKRRWHVTVWQVLREWCEDRGHDPDEAVECVRIRKGRAEVVLNRDPKYLTPAKTNG